MFQNLISKSYMNVLLAIRDGKERNQREIARMTNMVDGRLTSLFRDWDNEGYTTRKKGTKENIVCLTKKGIALANGLNKLKKEMENYGRETTEPGSATRRQVDGERKTESKESHQKTSKE